MVDTNNIGTTLTYGLSRFLQVTTLSAITTVDGTTIIVQSWQGKKITRRRQNIS